MNARRSIQCVRGGGGIGARGNHVDSERTIPLPCSVGLTSQSTVSRPSQPVVGMTCCWQTYLRAEVLASHFHTIADTEYINPHFVFSNAMALLMAYCRKLQKRKGGDTRVWRQWYRVLSTCDAAHTYLVESGRSVAASASSWSMRLVFSASNPATILAGRASTSVLREVPTSMISLSKYAI